MALLPVLLALALAACTQEPGPSGPIPPLGPSDEVPATAADPPCDTIRIGKSDLSRFVPLSCALNTSDLDTNDAQLIRMTLSEGAGPVGSMWVRLPGRGDHHAPIRSSDLTIEVDLYFRAGLDEEMEIERSGGMRDGNWSGRDGTLVIDKRTGASHVKLWQ